MAKAKSNGATDEAAGVGHNKPPLTEADFNALLARLGAAESEKQIAQAKVSKIRKEMKAAGILLKNFDAMRTLADLPRQEQQVQLAHSRYYLQWLRSPLGSQMTLGFDEQADPLTEDDAAVEARIVEDAAGDGHRAGVTGKLFEKDCPHDANTKAGQAWIGAYRAAQKEAAKALKGA